MIVLRIQVHIHMGVLYISHLPGNPLVVHHHLGYLILAQTGPWLVALPVTPAPIVPPPFDAFSATPLLYDEPSCKAHAEGI